jgi:hypothetical protein
MIDTQQQYLFPIHNITLYIENQITVIVEGCWTSLGHLRKAVLLKPVKYFRQG